MVATLAVALRPITQRDCGQKASLFGPAWPDVSGRDTARVSTGLDASVDEADARYGQHRICPRRIGPTLVMNVSAGLIEYTGPRHHRRASHGTEMGRATRRNVQVLGLRSVRWSSCRNVSVSLLRIHRWRAQRNLQMSELWTFWRTARWNLYLSQLRRSWVIRRFPTSRIRPVGMSGLPR
jgi:hypothetical protein